MSFVHRVAELVEEKGNALTGKADHWERVPLGSVAKVINGFPFPSGGFDTEEGEPVIRIRDVTSGTVGTFFRGDASEAPRAEYGDLVIGMDGDFNSRLWPGQSALINQRVCKVVPNEAYYSRAFLAYVIPGYLKLVNDHTSAITVKHLSSGTVHDLPLPLPPRGEQDRLVSKLDELFSRIDEGERALERVQKLVERYRQSVLKAAVTGELTRDWREKNKDQLESGEALLARILKARREAWEKAELDKMKAKGIPMPANDKWKQKYEEPATPDTAGLRVLPDGWTWASVDQLSLNHDGRRIPLKASDRDQRSGPYPYYGAQGVIDDIDDFLFDGDFLLVAEDGENLRSRIKPLAFNASGKFWVNNHAHILSPVRGVHRDFLRAAINAKNIALSVTGTAQPKLTQAALCKLAVPIASEPEQEAIVVLIDAAMCNSEAAITPVALEFRRAGSLRQSILRAAFCGSLVSQDVADEPASVLLERIAAERADAPAKPKRGRKPKTSEPA